MDPLRAGTIVAGRVLTPDEDLGPTRLAVSPEGTIAALEPLSAVETAALDTAERARILTPGLVDLQVNGIDDVDVARADGAAWDRLDALLLAQGVTAWCPTLVSAPRDHYQPALARITAAAGRPGPARPEIIGVHLEGPFLGARTGAHPPACVPPLDEPVDVAWLLGLGDLVRLVTLGPERPGAPAAIRALRERDVTVALGHTSASAAELEAACEAGASIVTHLFNAMTGLDHREPGVAAWALADQRPWLGLIADGVHVDPLMIRLAATAARDRIVLVTDAVAWRAQRGLTRVGGAPRLPDGTIAGSTLTLDAAVRTCVERAGLPLGVALRAATSAPAQAVGRPDLGAIRPGARADLVAWTPDLRVEQVWCKGRAAPLEAPPLP